MVRAYIVNHQDFTEDCGCVHYIAQAFDDQGNNNQLQASAPVLKLQDYVPAHTSPVPAVPPRTASPVAVMAPSHYRSAELAAVFHPPCPAASLFLM